MRKRDKQQQRQRYLKQIKKHRSLEEQKEIQAHSKARKGKRLSDKGRSRREPEDLENWEDTESSNFEKIRRADRYAEKAKSKSKPLPIIEAPETGVDLEFGTVLEVHPGLIKVYDKGAIVRATVPPDLSFRGELVVGDQVSLEKVGPDQFRVLGRGPRKTVLSRPDPGTTNRRLVQAANVDLVGIVIPANQLKTGLIDRYLIAIDQGASDSQACRPLIVLNKVDLIDDEARAKLEVVREDYRALGVASVLTSALTGVGLKSLRASLQGKISVFVGQSGVGKSSLLNAMVPDSDQKTHEVRQGDGKGRHTTTSSRLIYADAKTSLIDTPGIRAFGLSGLSPDSLDQYFPDFPSGCRFRNCRHIQEPECAVREAALENEPSAKRYTFYLRLWHSLASGDASV